MIDLLVMTDGRDHIFETIPSAEAFLVGPISTKIIHDDSGNPANAERLHRVFPDWQIVQTSGRAGFGGAIRSAWTTLRELTDAPYIFHLEDDFTFNRTVELVDLAAVLDRRQHLVQIALRRQPWNAAEVAAGGVVELHADDWTEHFDGERAWLESARNFTTNPGLYRRRLIEEHEWPTGQETEGRFGIGLLEADPETRFGFWGARDSGEWVRHIGAARIGTGY